MLRFIKPAPPRTNLFEEAAKAAPAPVELSMTEAEKIGGGSQSSGCGAVKCVF